MFSVQPIEEEPEKEDYFPPDFDRSGVKVRKKGFFFFLSLG
jgi:hypothetical protein